MFMLSVTEIGCHDLLNPPSNGFIIRKYSNALLEFRCYDNFVLQGPSLTFCNGFSWNTTTSPTTCVPANTAIVKPPVTRPVVIGGTRCTNAPVVPNTMLEYQRLKDSRGVLYWNAKYTCQDGFSASQGDFDIYCSEGNWVGTLPTCVFSYSKFHFLMNCACYKIDTR